VLSGYAGYAKFQHLASNNEFVKKKSVLATSKYVPKEIYKQLLNQPLPAISLPWQTTLPPNTYSCPVIPDLRPTNLY